MTFAAVLITAVAVCYGWGVRGYIIGGEKGAMLPGALLGLSLTLFTKSETALAFASVGAIAMFRGGTEPYGDTIDGIRRRNRGKNRFGLSVTGTFIKGALWFGIAGITLSMMTGATLFYKGRTIFLILLIPFAQALGVRIFNKPYDRAGGRFPKIYFSEGAREEWGGSVLEFLLLCVIAAVNGDVFSLVNGFAGILGGGAGFVAGVFLDDICSNPVKNGKYIFGKFYLNGRIDTWKIMEHSFGFIASFTVASAFLVQKNTFEARLAEFSVNSVYQPFEFFGSNAAGIILFALIILSSLQYPARIVIRNKTGRKPEDHIFELTERPLYETLPLFLIFSGNAFVMRYYAVFALMYVLGEKLFSDSFEKFRNKGIIISVGIITSLSGLIPVFTVNPGFVILPLLITIVLYTLFSIIISFPSQRPHSKSSLTVLTHFALETVFITAVSVLAFC